MVRILLSNEKTKMYYVCGVQLPFCINENYHPHCNCVYNDIHLSILFFHISTIEVFLKERAKHPPHCYRAYDALRLCLIQKIDTVTCGKIVEAYRPCARELRKEKLKRVMALEDERRKMLAAKAKVFEEKSG
jgi:hypothetical protein